MGKNTGSFPRWGTQRAAHQPKVPRKDLKTWVTLYRLYKLISKSISKNGNNYKLHSSESHRMLRSVSPIVSVFLYQVKSHRVLTRRTFFFFYSFRSLEHSRQTGETRLLPSRSFQLGDRKQTSGLTDQGVWLAISPRKEVNRVACSKVKGTGWAEHAGAGHRQLLWSTDTWIQAWTWRRSRQVKGWGGTGGIACKRYGQDKYWAWRREGSSAGGMHGLWGGVPGEIGKVSKARWG